jgi:hypothetical protein
MRPRIKKRGLSGAREAIPPKPVFRPEPLLKDLLPIKQPREPKILVIDIETSPIEGYVWGTWDQNLNLDQIKEDWSILSYAAKWVGQRQAIYADTGGRGPGKVRDDSILMQGLWDLMHAADIVVAHNGLKFDIKKINWRLLMHNFTPYSPVRVIDTLRVSRSLFAATSHKLGWLSQKMTDTPKDEHRQFPGWKLWLECLADNPKVWSAMRRYNVKDIRATEKVYMRQRPWIYNHYNLAVYIPGIGYSCPRCASTELTPDGIDATQSTTYIRYQCKGCGGWSRGKNMQSTIEKRRSLLVPE